MKMNLNEKVLLKLIMYNYFYLNIPSMSQCISLMRSENNKDIRNLSTILYECFMFIIIINALNLQFCHIDAIYDDKSLERSICHWSIILQH